jgi:hypothetical protein
MALTHERNKSSKTRRGCILCYNIGAAAPAFCYITVTWIPMYKKVDPVCKEIPLCFRHAKPKTESNPNGILDKEFGSWMKTPFGWLPYRDGNYQLVGGASNTQLVTGPSGKIPTWF